MPYRNRLHSGCPLYLFLSKVILVSLPTIKNRFHRPVLHVPSSSSTEPLSPLSSPYFFFTVVAGLSLPLSYSFPPRPRCSPFSCFLTLPSLSFSSLFPLLPSFAVLFLLPHDQRGGFLYPAFCFSSKWDSVS